MNTNLFYVTAGAVIAAVLLLAAYNFFLKPPEQHVLGEVHEHADFKVFLNGVEFNFSQTQYMSEKPPDTSSRNVNATSQRGMLSNFVHLHGGDGEVIHVHLKGINLGYFFRSLGMRFNSTCFVTDLNQTYCNTTGKTLKLFVNGKQNVEYDEYVPQDLDRILVSFGSETQEQLRQQIDSVSERACIQSLKCSEKGTPKPEDSCTTGGTGCAPEPSYGQ